MATGLNTTTTEADVIETVLSRARDYMEKPTVMTDERVVTQVTLEDGDGLTYNWPKFGNKWSAQTLSEGTPLNIGQTLVATPQQFTTGEYGLMYVMTDKAKRVTKERMWARAGRFGGNAMRRYREVQGLALFAGLSRDLGTANNPFTPGWLSAAKVRLTAASETGQTEPVEGDVVAVIHPFHAHDFLTSSATLGSNINSTSGYFPIPGWTEELVREYNINRVYGVDVLQAPLISVDGNDDAIAAIFNKMAFINVQTSHKMKSEKDRDIQLRADLLVVTAEEGWGELEDQFGLKAIADATAPTS